MLYLFGSTQGGNTTLSKLSTGPAIVVVVVVVHPTKQKKSEAKIP